MSKNRGISVEDIAKAMVEHHQQLSGVQLNEETTKEAVMRALLDPMLQVSIMMGLELDQKAEEGKDLSDVVRQLIVKDDPLCNVDELLAKAPLHRLGIKAIDRFHELDVTKSINLMRKLDSQTDKKRVNMFADDLIAAIVVMAERDLIEREKLPEPPLKKETKIQQSKKKRSRSDHITTKKLRQEVENRLKVYGLTVDRIAEIAYQNQKPFNPKLKPKDAVRLTKNLLGFGMLNRGDSATRELYYAILFLFDIDQLIKNGKFSHALMQRFESNVKEYDRDPYIPLHYIVDGVVSRGDIARARLGDNRRTENLISPESRIANDLGLAAVGNVNQMIADQQRRKAERWMSRGSAALNKGIKRISQFRPKRGRNNVQNEHEGPQQMREIS